MASDWDQLCGRFRDKAFLTSSLRILDRGDEIIFETDRLKGQISGLVIGLFGSVFVFLGLFVIPKDAIKSPRLFESISNVMTYFGAGAFTLAGGFVALLGFAIAISSLLASRRLRLTMHPPTLSLSGRKVPAGSIPAAELEVRLGRRSPESSSSTSRGEGLSIREPRAQRYRLELVPRWDPNKPLLLATSQERAELLELFEPLSNRLAVSKDESLAQLELSAGTSIFVDPEPLKAMSANFRTCSLVIISPQLAEIRATTGQKLFSGGFVLFGLGGLVSGFAHLVPRPHNVWPGGVVSAGVGAALLASGLWLRPKPIIFDLVRGVVMKKGGRMPLPEMATGLPLNRLCALQICSHHVSGGDSAPYTSYQLNAVLREPAGKRFVIMSDCERERLTEQARQLAQMLSLQLIDDAT